MVRTGRVLVPTASFPRGFIQSAFMQGHSCSHWGSGSLATEIRGLESHPSFEIQTFKKGRGGCSGYG